jgi:hypothetical protein
LNLAVIFNRLGVDSHKYISFRVIYLIVGPGLCVVSYLRDWFSPQVAMPRATGEGWQTRIIDTLRASLHLAGRV